MTTHRDTGFGGIHLAVIISELQLNTMRLIYDVYPIVMCGINKVPHLFITLSAFC